MTRDEWRWLRDADETAEHADAQQFEFYRSLFVAIEQLFAMPGGPQARERANYRLYTSFLLEYERVTMLLVSR